MNWVTDSGWWQADLGEPLPPPPPPHPPLPLPPP